MGQRKRDKTNLGGRTKGREREKKPELNKSASQVNKTDREAIRIHPRMPQNKSNSIPKKRL